MTTIKGDWNDFVTLAQTFSREEMKRGVGTQSMYLDHKLITEDNYTKINRFNGFEGFVEKEDWLYYKNQLVNTTLQSYDLFQLVDGTEEPPTKIEFKFKTSKTSTEFEEPVEHLAKRCKIYENRNGYLSKLLSSFIYQHYPKTFRPTLLNQTNSFTGKKDGAGVWKAMSIFMEDSNVQSDIHSLRKYHTMAQSQGETAALYIQRVQQHREFVE